MPYTTAAIIAITAITLRTRLRVMFIVTCVVVFFATCIFFLDEDVGPRMTVIFVYLAPPARADLGWIKTIP